MRRFVTKLLHATLTDAPLWGMHYGGWSPEDAPAADKWRITLR